MSKNKKCKKKKKVQIIQENFTSEIFDKKLCGIREKLKNGMRMIIKADELLYEVLADCYVLSAEFSGEGNDEAHRILKEKCEQLGVMYDETDIQHTLLKLVIKNPYEKGSTERKKENARIATYARALNKLAQKEIVINDVLTQLKTYGIDYWANNRKENEERTSANLKKALPLSKKTLNFFNRHTVLLNSFVVFAIGDAVYCSNDEELIEKLKGFRKNKEYEFDDINEVGKSEGK